MKSNTGKTTGFVVALVVLALAAGAFVWSGLYNIGADDPHYRATHAILETLRERSIETRAGKLDVPDLSDPARITQGAGNYSAMCTGCHLSPGMVETELSKGLYPAPPNLSTQKVEPAQAFWVIKHGIKASGMPAWGKSMADDYIWNMAAFLQKLPTLDAAQYRAMVANSSGHSHGGGESGEHENSHSESEELHDNAARQVDDHHAATADEHVGHQHSAEGETSGESGSAHSDSETREHAGDAAVDSDKAGEVKMKSHRHADGTVERHPIKPVDPANDHPQHDH